jgi:hypothetical protein
MVLPSLAVGAGRVNCPEVQGLEKYYMNINML